MKKQIMTAAVASTLALGTAPHFAGAVEYDEVKDQYPALTGWTEEDWNNYLEENYGTSLADYDTVGDLEGDLGEPIDLDSIANGDRGDQNILDIMEKYDLDSAGLVALLDQYENRDNIYFAGDLENALLEEGYEPVNITDEETDGTDESGESTEPEKTDETIEGTVNNKPDSDENDDVFMSRVEETYLEPLGWSVDEFNTYLNDNYDMSLDDFDQLEDLVAKVGPVLTDENEMELIEEYGLTEDEYKSLLEEYGETPEDYQFLYELGDALRYYTSESPNNAETEKGAEMPETASDSLSYALLGVGVAMLGGMMLAARRKFGDR
ncbi:processed acidic surface protein [Bacillus infantis]|uniref:processed acidic surface protein n=1 Tax=Bacillus infantis TaxID=324767 RepID=UPI001CD2E615|nr:processed acidic surface protein [Bacillus infantis]MCA1041234.1 processed acidic surface protein [Bacillus infantis]